MAANFVLVPAIGYAIAAALLPAQPHVMVGLAIYFMAPCTDWFLGFTRLARGNVALGTALIPINMAAQLLLYPFYIERFTHGRAAIQAGLISGTLLHWFVAPLAGAAIAHHVLRRLLGATRFARLLHRADQATPWVLALLVMEIFAAHIAVILERGAGHRHAGGVSAPDRAAAPVAWPCRPAIAAWLAHKRFDKPANCRAGSRRAPLGFAHSLIRSRSTVARPTPLFCKTEPVQPFCGDCP